MRGLKKAIAVILAVNMIIGMLPGLWQKAYAASVPLTVESYSDGKLTVNWTVSGVKSVEIKYHSPDSVAPGKLETRLLSASGTATLNSASVEGLKNDYIYDIQIKMYNAASVEIGEGTLYFLPQISFHGEIVKQQSVIGTGGGTESGVMPALKLSWNVPQIYDGTGFVAFNNAGAFAKLDSRLVRFNYKINISDSVNRTDIDVIWNRPSDSVHSGMYSANVSGDDSRISSVKYDSAAGIYYFYLLGIKDDSAHFPDITEVMANSYTENGITRAVLPEDISSVGDNAYVLPDKEILPGTVYYFKINPYPTDSTFNPSNHVTGYIDCLSVGPSGSPMLGSYEYIYTPIRFELTKDSMDNVNVKIFKINKGNLTLPQLYYEVQLNSIPSDQDSTWNQGAFKDKGKRLDGTYFTGEYAYTVITGVSPNNSVYYRIVVKSNSSSDRLESMKAEYTIKDDVSKPPVPRNVTIVSRQLVTMGANKSTNVTISWDKPSNWSSIKANTDVNEDIVFHFMLNLSQSDMGSTPYTLEADGKTYGKFPVNYRLVGYVSSKAVVENGNRLEYTIEGFNLFKGKYWLGGSSGFEIQDLNNPQEEDGSGNKYPNFLLPNKAYYLQMYTTKAVDKGKPYDDSSMSYKSLTVSFTTLTGVERDVPLPGNFGLVGDPTKDTVVIKFDEVEIDWSNYTENHTSSDKIYYDIYMSTRTETDSFIRIGTTELMNTLTDDTKSDLAFERMPKATDQTKYSMQVTVNKFRPGIGEYTQNGVTLSPYEIFGNSLTPNTTYYFIVKTRLYIPPENQLFTINPSVSTVILPVTTDRGDIGDPDTSAKRPLAPIDFAIAKDANGNLLLTGQTVTFSWTRKETGVRYSLISTSAKVAPDEDDDGVSSYASDPLYTSFIAAFGGEDNNTDNNNSKFTLDPAANPQVENFEYDSRTQTYTLTINRWLFPNKLYYFSLRAETGSGSLEKDSVWISIPVTTSLIEAPTVLAPVNDAELGFYWTGSVSAKSEDYRVYLKGPQDSGYKLLTKNQYTVVKDGVNCYGRIYNLKTNTSYNVKVYEGNSTSALYDKTGLNTRDGYHQIDVKWKGLPVDPYTKYEIAIKTADASDYTILSDTDLEQYMNINGAIVPYYFEKTAQTVGNNYQMYYARIKTAAVTLSDGSVLHQPLKSNMKYYIKVRAVKYDPSNTALISYSKYIGPVDTRTEFNQKDYDDTDEDNVKKATFLDKIAKLEEKLFWRVGMSNTTASKILLKGDRMVNVIQNSSAKPYTLDISGLGSNMSIDVIYMPVSIAKALTSENKSLVVKTLDAEYTFRRGTLDVDNAVEAADMKNKQGVKDLFLKVTVTRGEYPDTAIPKNTKRVSKVQDFKVEVVGSSKTDPQLKQEFHDRVYDDKTGLVKQKIDIISNPYNDNADTKEKLNLYIDQLVKDTESELSDYINSTIEGANGSGGMIVDKKYLSSFGTPMLAKLSYSEQTGLKLPYVLYDGSGDWRKLTAGLVYSTPNSVTFSVVNTGRYAIFASAASAGSIANDYWAKASIDKFTAKYDLSDIFAGINTSFNPETSVSAREIILIYEKVLNKTADNTGLDLKQKTKDMGLDSIVNLNSLYKDISRQESAAVFVKIYCAKTGISAVGLRPTRNISITDEADIGSRYFTQVLMVIDLGLMKPDDEGRFKPKTSITRAETISAFVKILELAGEM